VDEVAEIKWPFDMCKKDLFKHLFERAMTGARVGVRLKGIGSGWFKREEVAVEI